MEPFLKATGGLRNNKSNFKPAAVPGSFGSILGLQVVIL